MKFFSEVYGMDDTLGRMRMDEIDEKILIGVKGSTWRKTCPSATFFTKYPTWAYLGLKPVLSRDRPVTNGLSNDTSFDITAKDLGIILPPL